MRAELTAEVERRMLPYLTNEQLLILREALSCAIAEYEEAPDLASEEDLDPMGAFIGAKRVEGCSEKTLSYYRATIEAALRAIGKPPRRILTEDLRDYLITETVSLRLIF